MPAHARVDRRPAFFPAAVPVRSRRTFGLAGLIAGVLLLGGMQRSAVFAADVPAGSAVATELDDPPAPLEPAKRSEAEQDRLQATALFAAARTSEQRQDYPAALKQYERALRLDPHAMPILREIVAVAFNLDRRAEAARYALLMTPTDPDDALLLRRLGIELADEGDWDGALRIYEKVTQLQSPEKAAANTVLWWMETGRLYYLSHKYEQAARQFKQVLKALESPAEYGLTDTVRKALLGSEDLTYQLFGESFLDAKEPALAREAFEKSEQAKANPGLLAYNRARVLAAEKQPAKALEQLETYFDKHLSSQGTGPYQLLCELLDGENRSAERLPKLEKLHAADEANVPLTFSLAEEYRRTGDTAKAEALYRQLCTPGAKRPPIDAYQALAALLHKAGRWQDLLQLLGDIAGKLGGFDALGDSGKQLLADQQAVAALLEAAKEKPSTDDYGPPMAAALLAMEAKQFDRANQLFEQATRLAGQKVPELQLTWGLEMLAGSQYAAAAKVFQQGIEQKVLPADNPSFHFYLAGALEMSGQTDEAVAEARKAADLQKDSARHQSRVGWILYHAKRYEQARQAYAELIKRFDGSQESADVRDVLHDARLVLSNIAVAEHDMPAAEEWLEQVLDEYPTDAGALNDLGYLWTDQGKHLERSLRMIQAAVEADPKNMAYRDSLGWAYFRLGRFPQAVAELKLAADVAEPDGVVLDHLGDALLAHGDRPAAEAVWKRAVSTFDKEGEATKSRQTQAKLDRAAPDPS